VSVPRVVYEQAISHLQILRTILVPCGRKMIFAGLFGGGEDNIHV
jgi:hypothetical protein